MSRLECSRYILFSVCAVNKATFVKFEVNLYWCGQTADSMISYKSYELQLNSIVIHMTCNLSSCLVSTTHI